MVPGIELSVRVDRGTFHLLGYFAEPEPPALMARMDEIAGSRERRNAEICARLARLGVPVDERDVRARATGRVGRPHIAAAMVAAGYCADTDRRLRPLSRRRGARLRGGRRGRTRRRPSAS